MDGIGEEYTPSTCPLIPLFSLLPLPISLSALLIPLFLSPSLQLMQHSRDLSFRQEVQFRNQIAEYLTSWVKGQVCISANASHKENLQK